MREDFPSLYGQVLGRKDITKLTDEDLKAALSKVRELGSEAESHSASEMVEHEESLGF